MNNKVFSVYSGLVNSYSQARQGYKNPIYTSLVDMFVFSHYDISNTRTRQDMISRKLLMASYYDGWVILREHVPNGEVDLFELSEKGIQYIMVRMEFDTL